MIPVIQTIDGVDYPLYVLRRTDDLTVQKSRVRSNAIGDPVTDEDSGLEYLPMMTDEVPDYDPIYQFVVRSEGPNEKTQQWEITLTLQDRPKDEVLKAADDAKRIQIARVAPSDQVAETGLLVLAAVIRAGKFNFTPAEQADADAVVANAAKLSANRDYLATLKAQIDAGGKPDLKDGWSAVAVAVDVGIDATPLKMP